MRTNGANSCYTLSDDDDEHIVAICIYMGSAVSRHDLSRQLVISWIITEDHSN